MLLIQTSTMEYPLPTRDPKRSLASLLLITLNSEKRPWACLFEIRLAAESLLGADCDEWRESDSLQHASPHEASGAVEDGATSPTAAAGVNADGSVPAGTKEASCSNPTITARNISSCQSS